MTTEDERRLALDMFKQHKTEEWGLQTFAFTTIVGLGTYIFGYKTKACDGNVVSSELVGTWYDLHKSWFGWGDPMIQGELWKALAWAVGVGALIVIYYLRTRAVRKGYVQAADFIVEAEALSHHAAGALGLQSEATVRWHQLMTWVPISALAIILVSVLW